MTTAWDRRIEDRRYGGLRAEGLARATGDMWGDGLAEFVSAEEHGDLVTITYRLNRAAIERVMGAYDTASAMAKAHFAGRPLDVARFADCAEVISAHDNEVLKTIWLMGPWALLQKTGLEDAVRAELWRRHDAKTRGGK